MKDVLSRGGKTLHLKKEQAKALNIPSHYSKGETTCFTHGCVVVLVSGYANYKLIYRSIKHVLEEMSILKDIEKEKVKQTIDEEVVQWK